MTSIYELDPYSVEISDEQKLTSYVRDVRAFENYRITILAKNS